MEKFDNWKQKEQPVQKEQPPKPRPRTKSEAFARLQSQFECPQDRSPAVASLSHSHSRKIQALIKKFEKKDGQVEPHVRNLAKIKRVKSEISEKSSSCSSEMADNPRDVLNIELTKENRLFMSL